MKQVFLLIIVTIINLWALDPLTMVYENGSITELRDVFALDNGNVWAVGTDGYVVKSTNHGSTWSTVTLPGSPTDYHLNGVFFATTSNGCIVGAKKADPDKFKGKIWRTTNGGTTWDASINYAYMQAPAMYISFNDIAFDIRTGGYANKGSIAAGEGYRYYTEDYGENWSREQIVSAQHCWQGVCYKLSEGSPTVVYLVGDAGDSTGVFASNDGSGWAIEYLFPNLCLNFFDVASNGNVRIAASKGYTIEKTAGNWGDFHRFPDQQVLYGVGSCIWFSNVFLYGGSDEIITRVGFDFTRTLNSKCIKAVSPARDGAYGPSLLNTNTFFVGTGGRIFKLTHGYFDDWPPSMTVTGQSGRVKMTITDSEETSIADIYRSTCSEGPFQLVMTIDYPVGTSIHYDSSVDWNTTYYYYIGDVYAGSATPWGLATPPTPPSAPTNFLVQDIPSDNGGQVYLTWDWISPSYALYRDGKCMLPTTAVEYIDTNAITGKNHQYEIRKRQYYGTENDYVYSSPVTAYCTPVNNLTPSAPTGLTGEVIYGSGIKMRWTEPANFDVHGYNIYRRINAGNFYKVNTVPCPRAFWYDWPQSWLTVSYKVTAVDWAGNESGYSNTISFTYNPPESGEQSAFEEPIDRTTVLVTPNPLAGEGTIHLNLAQGGIVKIDLLDVSGSVVRGLVTDRFSAGTHALPIMRDNLKNLSRGVYFIRVSTSDQQLLNNVIINK